MARAIVGVTPPPPVSSITSSIIRLLHGQSDRGVEPAVDQVGWRAVEEGLEPETGGGGGGVRGYI